MTTTDTTTANDMLDMSILQLEDAKRVLTEVGLHPLAAALIESSVIFGSTAMLLPYSSTVRQGLVQIMTAASQIAEALMVKEQ